MWNINPRGPNSDFVRTFALAESTNTSMTRHAFLGVSLGLCLATLGCGPNRIARQRLSPELAKTADTSSHFIKVHVKDGGVYVLAGWQIGTDTIFGHGVHLDQYRDTISASSKTRSNFAVPMSNVAIIETNGTSLGEVTPFSVIAVAHFLTTVFCIFSPKTCFGSCPTFYINQDGREALVAEGFSSSISPSLEAEDIDALYRFKPSSRDLDITMKNEALETHVVKQVDVLAVPRNAGCRVFKSDDGSYWESSHIACPTSCTAREGDILDRIQEYDGVERRSWTDSNDLAKQEVIDVSFGPSEIGDYGIVIAARQTFVSTFLFYQGMSYLGTTAGDYYARLERGDSSFVKQFEHFKTVLGGIEVLVELPSGTWEKKGAVTEEGPIASDVHCIKLTGIGSPKHVQLRMAQGSWRIDWIAMAKLDRVALPIRIQPIGRVQTSKQMLLDSTNGDKPETKDALVTLPGEVYRYSFHLPENPDAFEYFLSARGYYLEWMREEWSREENPVLAAQFFMMPEVALKTNAGKFKQLEQAMEVEFWKSKIAGAAQ